MDKSESIPLETFSFDITITEKRSKRVEFRAESLSQAEKMCKQYLVSLDVDDARKTSESIEIKTI